MPRGQQPLDQLWHLAGKAGARDHEVDPGGLGGLAQLRIGVRVEAQHRGPVPGHRVRADALDVDDQQLRLLQRRCRRRAHQGHLVAGGAESLLDAAAEQQVGGDRDDSSHAS